MSPEEKEFRASLVALLPRLRRFARALAGASGLAEDLLQTGMEKAVRSVRTFDNTRRLDSWMFKILENAWSDMRMDMFRHQHAELDEQTAPLVDDRPSIEARDDLRQVSRAFERLPEEQRAALTLVVIEELTYKDAAYALGVPIGTIMSRLARGRAALASAVRAEGTVAEVRGKHHE